MREPDVIMRIEAAWKEISDNIYKQHKQFLKDNDENSLGDKHFVIWEEADIPFQIGRFLLADQDDGKYEFHLEMNLKSKNFDGYSFSDNGNLERVKKVLKRDARVDFLVDDLSNHQFPVIGEAKYFRYSIEGISRGRRDVLDEIQKDYEKLKTFIENKICKYGVYFVVDKWYHRNDPKTWNKIVKKLEKIESNGIYVFKKEV